jgi:hypothetical protein
VKTPINGGAWQEDSMHDRTMWRAAAAVASVTVALGGATLASAGTGQPHGDHHGGIRHVLLISVDGMHQQGY